ncbi:MAG TPA: hypothetical protein VEZ48_03335 [Sphingomonadaceae bacterium]|nr:hypothetical protein [Sphingomonadaceae bacterium]
MPRRPNPRAYTLENAAFLRHLRRTGNAHEAARALAASRSRFTRRRAKDPAFAARWDAALVVAQASLSSLSSARGGGPPPKAVVEGPLRSNASSTPEPHLLLRRDGTVQLRRRLPTAISPAAEQRFLTALAACANVRLAARAAGFSHASFYARKRRHPGFARQWQAALAQGYERLQLALLESWSADSHDQDAWAHNAPPPMPPMSANQALQLMYLHQKEARAMQEPPVLRRRRGETHEAVIVRQVLIHEAWMERDRAAFREAEAARRAKGERPYWDGLPDPHEPPAPVLPDLAQLMEGSSLGGHSPGRRRKPPPEWTPVDPADPPPDGGELALFGGWRIDDWRRAQAEEEEGEIISERPARGKGSRGPRRKRGGEGGD